MKKTIIAASIAAVVAAPAAFADVSISGSVQVEYIEDTMETRNDIVIKSSEDLGNGMKAGAKMHLVKDDGTDGGSNGDFSASLSGSFGKISVGRMEGFQEAIFNPITSVDASHDVDLEGNFDGKSSTDAQEEGFTRAEMIQYVSPSFNGLTFGVNAQDDGTDKFADTEVMAQYSNAGLTVAVNVASEGTDDFETVIAKYKMGDLELRAGARSHDDGTVEYDSTFIGAKYTMGANTISVGSVSTDNDNGDATVVGLAHALSKKTSVYVAHKNSDDADNQTAIGMKVAF